MLEFECHAWGTLRGFRESEPVRGYLERVVRSTSKPEWEALLRRLETYASDLGIPSEATKDVVGCLVAIAVSVQGAKLSSVLASLEELTCGRGIEQYSPDQLTWLQESVEELGKALHTWTALAENGSTEDAALAADLLAYCATHVPDLKARATRYLELCAARRPELREEVSALLDNATEVRELVAARHASDQR